MSDIEAIIREMEIDGDPILAYYAGRLRESLLQVPEVVSFWRTRYESAKRAQFLANGHAIATTDRMVEDDMKERDKQFARKFNPAPPTSGEVQDSCAECPSPGSCDGKCPGGTSATPAQAGALTIVGWMYEDELPERYPYDEMFPYSKVDIVRMFPVYAPADAQAGAELPYFVDYAGSDHKQWRLYSKDGPGWLYNFGYGDVAEITARGVCKVMNAEHARIVSGLARRGGS